jgi:hypothetical protein
MTTIVVVPSKIAEASMRYHRGHLTSEAINAKEQITDTDTARGSSTTKKDSE